MEIKLETLSRECIKPSTPTPSHLRTFKLSLLDQLSPNIHGNLTLFYPSKNHDANSDSEFSTKSQLLRNSLSQTLTLFYPLAGRLQDATTIDCNDEGVFFIESKTHTTLSETLSHPDFDALQCFIPTTDKQTMAMSNGSMLLVRFTSFGCGATAVTISLTHKIADFATATTFLKAWTAACGGGGGGTEPVVVVPELATGAALFPPREIPVPGISASVKTGADKKFTSRRFVFNASKVAELRSRVKGALEVQAQLGEEGVVVFRPSRVEVVLALIWRCALSSSSRSKTASFGPSALFQAVNLRPRMEPPIPDKAVGNFVWPFAVTVEEESHVALHEMVARMRKAMREFLDTKAEKFKAEGAFGVVMESLNERAQLLNKDTTTTTTTSESDYMRVYKCSSWCNFPLFELDFGWGKPAWVSSVNKLVSNTIALMDTRDGGVEAFVTLDEEDMDLFEHHDELLHYAVLNPTIIIT